MVASSIQGLVIAAEILYIVFGVILLLTTLQASGALQVIRQSLLSVSGDRRVQVILLLGCLAALLKVRWFLAPRRWRRSARDLSGSEASEIRAAIAPIPLAQYAGDSANGHLSALVPAAHYLSG